jgi:regulator of replication initiation timing
VSIDRIGDLREELLQIKSSMNSLKQNVEETIQEEVQRVNNSLRMAYTKLEGDIEELKEDLVTIKAQEEIFSRSMSTEINV